jgi:hypothetical protein
VTSSRGLAIEAVDANRRVKAAPPPNSSKVMSRFNLPFVGDGESNDSARPGARNLLHKLGRRRPAIRVALSARFHGAREVGLTFLNLRSER